MHPESKQAVSAQSGQAFNCFDNRTIVRSDITDKIDQSPVRSPIASSGAQNQGV
jgi:hypothetical protein